jgi:hypothetical protein
MKLVTTFLTSLLVAGGIAQGAITVSLKNFTSATVGNPIVDAAGAAVAKNTIWASAGIFTTLPDWGTASASQVLSLFTAVDATPLVNSSFTGLFTGPDTSTLAAYATGFESAQAYFLVGNNANLALSTLIAVYRTPGQVYTPPVAGVASVAINGNVAANWVYGKQVTVTTQPVTLAGAAFTNGIQLTSVPEPTAALLGAIGALGLLRRRRI